MLKVILTLILFNIHAFGMDSLFGNSQTTSTDTLFDSGTGNPQMSRHENSLKYGESEFAKGALSSSMKPLFEEAVDEAGGFIFIKNKVDKFKKITDEQSSKSEFTKDYCNGLGMQALRNSKYFLLNTPANGETIEQKRIRNLSSSIVKEYGQKTCPKNPDGGLILEGCFQNSVADGKFSEICQNQVKSYLLSKANDVNLTEVLGTHLNKQAKTLGDDKIEIEKPIKSSCSDGCALLNPDGYFTSCNALECNNVGLIASTIDSFAPLNFIHMENSEFKPRGSKEFCSVCFMKAAKKRNKDFPIEEVREKFKNKVAGKVAAKELLGFAKVMETLSDYKSVGGIKKKIACKAELRNLLDSKCKDKKADKNFDSRVKEASNYLGLDITDSEVFLSSLSQKIKQESPGQTCNRTDYAVKKLNTYMSSANDDLRAGFKSLVAQLNNESLKKEMEQMCNNPKNAAKSETVSEFISSRLANNLVNMVSYTSNNNSSSLQSSWHKLACGSDDEFIRTIGCNEDGVAKDSGANKFFQTFHADHKEIIDAIQEKFSDVGEGGEIDQQSLKRLFGKMKELLKIQFQSTIDLASNYDPVIGVNLGSWQNVCTLMKRPDGNIEDLVSKNTYGPGVENFLGDACSKVTTSAKQVLCSDDDLDLSEEDLDKVTNELLEEEKAPTFAIKSLACSMRSKPLSYMNKLDFDDTGADVSDYEKKLSKSSSGSPGSPLDFDVFKENVSCTEGSRKFQEGLLVSTTDRYSHRVVNSDGVSKEADEQKRSAEKANRLISEQAREVRADVRSALRGEINRELSSREEGSVARVFEGGNPYPSSSAPSRSVAVDRGSRPPERIEASRVERVLADNQASKVDVKPKTYEVPPKGDDLFSYMKNPSNFEATNNASNGRSPANFQNTPICDDACLRETLAKQRLGKNSSEEEKNKMASKLGLKNPSETPEDMKKMLEDVLEGKLNEKELDELKAENEKLREEMAKIKADMAKKPVKVIDQNGVDRSKEIKRPESNPALVLNPRNNHATEYRSRSSMQEKAEQFSPDYTPSAPERVSIADYRSKRREAAKVPVDEVKNYNAEMDQTFLRSNSNSPVDDIFVKKYVSHVSKEAGSIEHLIVFENGVPAKIRVPDPKRPGSYVEHPLKGEIAEEILGQVERQEVQSFALYNMVSFGDSLSEFMQKLDTEASNITSLRSLNTRLKKLEELD